jgi:hypothetical protein
MNADLDVTLLGIPKKMRDFPRFRILQAEKNFQVETTPA